MTPDLRRTIDAGLVATGLCSLTARTDEHHELKRAFVHLFQTHFSTGQIASAMGLKPRTVRRLKSAPPERELLRAIRRQDSVLVAKAEELSALEGPLPLD